MTNKIQLVYFLQTFNIIGSYSRITNQMTTIHKKLAINGIKIQAFSEKSVYVKLASCLFYVQQTRSNLRVMYLAI